MTKNLLADIFKLSADLVEKASSAGKTVATAESCTGGLIGAAITATAGSSSVFQGGIIAYDNRIKTKLLGVPPSTLGKYGAVSEKVAERMAAGCAERLGVDYAVSVTGVAGPGGGSPEKPVGTVWIGVSDGRTATAILHHFEGMSRNKVRDHSCLEAMKLLISAIELG